MRGEAIGRVVSFAKIYICCKIVTFFSNYTILISFISTCECNSRCICFFSLVSVKYGDDSEKKF